MSHLDSGGQDSTVHKLCSPAGPALSHPSKPICSVLSPVVEDNTQLLSGVDPCDRYDKSAHGGRGDQAPSESWPVLKGPLQILFFEGWMSGFSPLPDAEVAAVDPALVPVNQQLAGYKEAWDQWVDNWLVVRIEDPQVCLSAALNVWVVALGCGKQVGPLCFTQCRELRMGTNKPIDCDACC